MFNTYGIMVGSTVRRGGNNMLRVFEAFSGVGSQHMALRNLNKEYKIVATADIDETAVLAYYYVHGKNKKTKRNVTIEEKRKFLLEKGIGRKKKIEKMDIASLEILYNAVVTTKNLGDIVKIKEKDIPDHDLFTYSFPCQDISSVGTKKGLDEGSGTRSSLLWECRKIIENNHPKYLLLENVKNLTTGKNSKNFNEWLTYLEDQGYTNYWKIFDAKDYGIPQRRPRVIVVSKYGSCQTNLIKDNPITEKSIDEIIDTNQMDWKKFKPKASVKGMVKMGELAFLDDRDWKLNGVMIGPLCSTQRSGRTGLKFIKNDQGVLYERKLNALECCRLMGYRDKDYYQMKKGNLTDNQIMKLCGNSIVVNVLENIFINIFEEEQND